MPNYVIRSLLDLVEDEELVLPAMQRPFVWSQERILNLMDSLMRMFPLGAILTWRTDEAQRYRRFSRDVSSDETPLFNYRKPERRKQLLYVLDGQQRLTSLYIASKGTLDNLPLYLDVLSGRRGDQDPGERYYDFRFMADTEAEKLNREPDNGGRQYFIEFSHFLKLDPVRAAGAADAYIDELDLEGDDRQQLRDTFNRAANVLVSEIPLRVHVIDEQGLTKTPISEILEIFVRINSGGLTLQKSDLLMSLLDLKWNDIQPALLEVAHKVSRQAPLEVTRDMILKTALLSIGEDSRFDKLVRDRDRIQQIAPALQDAVPNVERGWMQLATMLKQDCRILSPRFFRQATNALLPFAVYLTNNIGLSPAGRKKVVTGVYLALMSTIFGGAEARTGRFSRDLCREAGEFPLEELAELVSQKRHISSLDQLLANHLDLALNIAQGGVVLDGNPDELERDHIFPKSCLYDDPEVPNELVNHYANFHFLRKADNRNKLAKPPHEWFREPGKGVDSYTDSDMEERLLTWDLVEEGSFKKLVELRGQKIRDKAIELFGTTATEFDALLS